MNLNVHFDTLVLDGVFCELTPGRLEFHAATPPSDAAVAHVLDAPGGWAGHGEAEGDLARWDDAIRAERTDQTRDRAKLRYSAPRP